MVYFRCCSRTADTGAKLIIRKAPLGNDKFSYNQHYFRLHMDNEHNMWQADKQMTPSLDRC